MDVFRAVLQFSILLALVVGETTPCLAAHDVGPGTPVVIPISEVIGGTDVSNNAKNNADGGYYSVFDNISQFSYPDTHANQLGNTAMVNDHTYWDSPDGLNATHVPYPDDGGGNALWWPIPGEWASYEINVTAPATYTVLYRFSSGWGPSQPVIIHMEMDGLSSGPVTLAPDDPELWQNTYYQVGGWWGHTMVSGTLSAGWNLSPGSHVLRVFIDSFPEYPDDHGWIWIHYFKVMAGGTPITSAPGVDTLDATNVGTTSAWLNGTITSTGNDNPATKIYWGTTDGETTPGDWEHVEDLGTRGAGGFSFDATSLTTGTTYFYRCHAQNSVGETWASQTRSFTTLEPPAAPSGLSANTFSVWRIDLSWTDASHNEDNFIIERRAGAGPFAQVAVTWGNATTYTDTGLAPGTAYVYRVCSANGAGMSDWSNEASATTLPDQPAVITFTNPSAGVDVAGVLEVRLGAYDPDAGTLDGEGLAYVVIGLVGASSTAATLTDPLPPYEWSIQTRSYPDGNYTLQVSAPSVPEAGGGTATASLSIVIDNTSPSDADSDNLPDSWEIQYGFDPTTPYSGSGGLPDDEVDTDGDGLTNLEEFELGTNPLVAPALAGRQSGISCLAGAGTGGAGRCGFLMVLLCAAAAGCVIRARRAPVRLVG